MGYNSFLYLKFCYNLNSNMSVTSQQNKTGELEEAVVSDLQRFMT